MERFNSRVQDCLQRMQEVHMDQLVVSSKPNLKYLMGVEIDTGERMTVLLLSPGKKSKLIIHEMFVDQTNASNGIENIFYSDDVDPLKLLTTLISKNERLGIDQTWPSSYLIDLFQAVPNLSIQKSSIVEKIREKKDKYEIDILRQSARIADAVMHQIIQLQNFPATEREVSETIRSLFAEHGVNELSFKPIIGFGKNSANPHHSITNQVSNPNQPILIDMGGIYNCYCSDITRTYYHGKTDSKFEDLYKIVKDVQIEAIEMVKPGVRFSEIDLSIRRSLAKWGYDEFFIHRTGHGIGLELHEAPFIHQSNDGLVEEGMVFSIEPGVYLPDQHGIRIEDIVVVNQKGCEVLNQFSKEVQYLDLLRV
jgi:Xaa-Pro dipeptidase